MTKPKYLRTILISVLLFVLAGIFWFVFFQGGPEFRIEQQSQNTVEEIEVKEEEESPEVSASVEIVPQTSPTENTNPFENTYKNPFE